MTRLHFLAIVLFLSSNTLASAGDLDSGPEPGKSVPPLKVFDATGPERDKEVDYAKQRKDKPTLYAFVNAAKWDRPTARLMKKLDGAADKAGAYVVAVWLTEKVEEAKNYLPVAQQSLQFEHTALTCFPGDRFGPDGWNVNGEAGLTVVVADRGKVVASFGFRAASEAEAPKILKALETGQKKP